VLWERLTYGAEGPAGHRYFWTRPAGEMLVPVPAEGPVTVSFTWFAERDKDVQLSWDGGSVTLRASEDGRQAANVEIDSGVPRVDVVNNVGGIVLTEGYGADRGYQQVDTGQFDQPEEVFNPPAATGWRCARRSAGSSAGSTTTSSSTTRTPTCPGGSGPGAGRSATSRRPCCGTCTRRPARSGRRCSSSTSTANRLLMLTKNATTGLALRAVLRYPLTTASIAVRTLRQGLAARRRPPVRPTLLRLRVIGSYLRLLPRMLARRRNVARSAAVGRRELQRWLVSPPGPPLPPEHGVAPGEIAA